MNKLSKERLQIMMLNAVNVLRIDLFHFDVFLPNSNHTKIQIICHVDSLHFDIKKELTRDCELGNLHTVIADKVFYENILAYL